MTLAKMLLTTEGKPAASEAEQAPKASMA